MNLFEYKTYHEVIDEIYYKVTHLEPWEKGSRKTAGQTGMCGGVSTPPGQGDRQAEMILGALWCGTNECPELTVD